MRPNKGILSVFLIIVSILSISNARIIQGMPRPSSESIKWDLKNGNSFEWQVTISEDSEFDFLPAGSNYTLIIESIDTMTGIDWSESIINCTLLKYNNSDKSIEKILDNEFYLSFHASSNSNVTLHAAYIDQGFILPINYQDQFIDGFTEYMSSNSPIALYGWGSWGLNDQVGGLSTGNYSKNLTIDWDFYYDMGSLMFFTTKLTITQNSTLIYELKLDENIDKKNNNSDSEPTISFGLYIILIAGVIILFTVHYYRKRVKDNHN